MKKTLSILAIVSAVLISGCSSKDPIFNPKKADSTSEKTENNTGLNPESKQPEEQPSNPKKDSSGNDVKDDAGQNVSPDLSTTDGEEETSGAADPGLKSQVRLELPQSVQETGYWCAPASLQMVLEYHGQTVSQEELARELNTSPVTGTEYEDLARVASIRIFGKEPASGNESGYRAVLFKRNGASDEDRRLFEARLKEDLMKGDPVFVSINPAAAYPGFSEGVHQVVVYGMDLDDEGNVSSVYLRDPSYLSQDEEYEGKKVFSSGDLWHAMIDNAEPGYVW